ncbi:related to 3-phytase A precursor [Ustilago sp. UG-2017b]|nr:related to 3-phytase A precursor [Ustilago sp. UG-2017b]
MRQWKPALLALASTLGYGTSLWPTTQQGQEVDPSILTNLGAWSFYVPNGDIGRYDIPDAVFPGCEVDQSHPGLHFLSGLKDSYKAVPSEVLTAYGEQDAHASGYRFKKMYGCLLGHMDWYNAPVNQSLPVFVRTTDQSRVNVTSWTFSEGFMGPDWRNRLAAPLLTLPDSSKVYNDPLAVGTCPFSQNDTSSDDAFAIWNDVYLPKVVQRLQRALPNLNLTTSDVQAMQNAYRTSTNTTLDADKTTFPLGLPVYLDFTHNAQLASAVAVMGLPKDGRKLDLTKYPSKDRLWNTAHIVPMGGRMVVERLTCRGKPQKYVRILLNDAVLPVSGLKECGVQAQ